MNPMTKDFEQLKSVSQTKHFLGREFLLWLWYEVETKEGTLEVELQGVAGVNGIVLTKLDGTAKGGVAVAIAHDLNLPIRYVGVGEGIDDLVPFSAEEYDGVLFSR